MTLITPIIVIHLVMAVNIEDPTVNHRHASFMYQVKANKGIAQLISTMRISAPAFPSIFLVMALAFVIYAIAGMSLFGDVPNNGYIRYNDPDSPERS